MSENGLTSHKKESAKDKKKINSKSRITDRASSASGFMLTPYTLEGIDKPWKQS